MPLRARDVMQSAVVSVSPRTTLAALEDFLLAKRVGGVPVIDGGELVGIVSRSDVVRALGLERSLAGIAAEGVEHDEFAPAGEPPPPIVSARPDPASRTVRDIMVPDVVTVAPETPIAEVARLLAARHLHRVLVTEGRRVCGVISTTDLARLIADGRLREPA
jgi:CBS domain-containing protein